MLSGAVLSGNTPRMSNFTLAADPVRPWSTLLSSSNQFRIRVLDESSYILDGSVSGLPATIELYGTISGRAAPTC